MISISRKHIKKAAYVLLFDLLLGILLPAYNSVYALTSGPKSPEFSSFEPVATTNLVDPFSGNFTYNLPVVQIPGPDGGGYAMSLSYHSGVSPEEEASWVGHGWTLNPGSINRSVRGIPDEYNGTGIDYFNKTRPNWTMSGSEKLNVEFFSQSKKEGKKKQGNSNASGSSNSSSKDKNYDTYELGLGFSKHVRFNNYQGLAKTTSLSLASGVGSLSMNRSATGITFSANINPLNFGKEIKRNIYKHKDKEKKVTGEDKDQKKKDELTARLNSYKETGKSSAVNAIKGTFYSLRNFTDVGQSTSLSKLNGYNFNIDFGAQINVSQLPVGFEGGLSGKFSLNLTKPHDIVPTYGYLNTPREIGKYRTDYFTEKGQPFDRRDFFIGIPFSTPDNYSLTGEGLSGSFRPYRYDLGHYFPEQIEKNENKIKTYGIGVELMVGANVGVGVSLSFGSAKSNMEDWKVVGNTNNFLFSDTSHLYRFIGDLGGKVEYGNNDIVKAKLTANPNFPGITSVKPKLPNNNYITDLKVNEAKSTSLIIKEVEGFSIYNESGLKYNYTQDINVKNMSNLTVDIKEEDDIENNYLAYKKLSLNNQFDKDKLLQNHDVVVGQVNTNQYPTTSLLESITTPDYIKIGNKSFDEDDLGGWTSFEYYKKYGNDNEDNNSKDNWYRWRVPYNGMYYNKNSISDTKDDTGSVSTGDKEVYYLKKVETKTHVAYFVTNKSKPSRFIEDVNSEQAKFLLGTDELRKDALGAPKLTGEEDLAALKSNSIDKSEYDDLEYLEKIVLFAKDRPDIPLQTTNFKYDYTLVPNLPNNINGNFPDNTVLPNSGKLTLRKVWSEFEGVVNARISSYKFDYKYKDVADYPDYLINENPDLEDFFALSNTYSVNAQNPEYGPYLLDAWGNNQYDGENRHLKLRTWPYQGRIPKNAFDPAAWQLKQVTLPSGGQILVQYESKDYSYVQDRDVMALVKLNNFVDNFDEDDPTYTLDLSDIGYDNEIPTDPSVINPDLDKITELQKKLKKYFIEQNDPTNPDDIKVNNRIYFKFLYALEGNYPGIENCKSEYVSGYAKVKDVVLDTSSGKYELKIQLDGTSDGKNLIGVGLFDNPVEDEGYKLLPRQACYDYYVTQRWGKFSAGCESELEQKYDNQIKSMANDQLGITDNGNAVGDLKGAVKVAGYTLKGITLVSNLAVNSKYPKKYEVCKTINPELSYLKIPINKAKRGDGIRVKRVLMYDKGIEDGDAAVYGQQYRYELEDGRSSGVASNEPKDMREENPLVGFLPKKDQSWLNRLIVGKDREQSEGPIGESLLPSPSVRHSRVVVENIHTGKTGSGYTINEYYTCKDYPYDKLYDYSLQEEASSNKNAYDIKSAKGVEHTNLQEESYSDKLRIPAPGFSYSLDKAWASQGFRFILNNMHGKPKSMRTYGGTYESGNRSYISSGQDFYYYEPGEKIRMLKPNGDVVFGTPGKEMDVTMEKYAIRNQSLDFNFEIDVSVGLSLPPPIFGSGWLQIGYSDQYLSKHAVSKVIQYPAITKKIVSYSDNIASTSENVGFDYATGRTVLTKTYDAYHGIPINGSNQIHDGSIYNLNIPAHWNYEEMGRKSDVGTYTNQLLASSGQIVTYGEGASPVNEDNTKWNINEGRVISAGATTFNTLKGVSNWIDKHMVSEYTNGVATYDDVIVKLESIWRQHESYVFKGDTKSSSDRQTDSGKIYEGGILENFTPFDYTSSSQVENWVRLNTITKYSPNGNAIEEQDVLGIYSASKYGYRYTQPIMVAQNAQYDEIYFEHFEDKANLDPEIKEGIAHSGIYSRKINSGYNLISGLEAKSLLVTKGGWLKFWLRSDKDLENATINISGNIFVPEKVAKTGEWTLYRVFITPSAFILDQSIEAVINYTNASDIYIDDIKFAPKESQSTCFVYDVKSLRLVTMFDDQHFGLYYQYNNEGQLVRKLIETERGLKVITETQYNTPREKRDTY